MIALELLLARTDRAAVAVARLGAYPSGFELELVVLLPDDEDELDPGLFGHRVRHRRGRRAASDEAHLDRLRFGVQFADGSKATNLDPFDFDREPPEPPTLRPAGGGGGGGDWHQDIWVWPLPPPGPLAFVCDWPAAGIELTRVEIDAGLVIEASRRAQQLFDPPSQGGGTVSVVIESRE